MAAEKKWQSSAAAVLQAGPRRNLWTQTAAKQFLLGNAAVKKVTGAESTMRTGLKSARE